MRIADPADQYEDDNPRNIVNRLTLGGANGVQIEQSLEAREGFAMAIADAVAYVYREKLARLMEGAAPALSAPCGRGSIPCTHKTRAPEFDELWGSVHLRVVRSRFGQ